MSPKYTKVPKIHFSKILSQKFPKVNSFALKTCTSQKCIFQNYKIKNFLRAYFPQENYAKAIQILKQVINKLKRFFKRAENASNLQLGLGNFT